MTSQIVRIESDIADSDFSLMGVDCRVCLSESVWLQHVEEGGLTGVVETQEYNVSAFLEEAEPFKCTFKEINDEHFVWVVIIYYNLLNQVLFK